LAALFGLALLPTAPGCSSPVIDPVLVQCTGGAGATTHATGGGGNEAGGSTGGSAGTGGAPLACPGVGQNSSADCDACRSGHCCTEAQACAAEPACATWLGCEDACAIDDYECLRGCWKGDPASPAKGAYMACKQRSCASACAMDACTGAAYNYQDNNDDANNNGACRACRSEHCCEPLTTCLEDADCEEAFECYGTCPDSACMQSVCNNAEHAQLLIKIAPEWACRSRYCLAACNAEPICSTVFYSQGDCQTCTHANCCAETKACSEDVECVQHALCVHACADYACQVACDSTYWIGAGLDYARQYCLSSHCTTECTTGPPSVPTRVRQPPPESFL
jgi:hypothetical protein